MLGPMLWYLLSLLCWHPIIEHWFWALDVLLLVQFPAHAHGEAVDDGPSAWTPAKHMGDFEELPGFS